MPRFVVVGSWGKSLAVRLPAAEAERAGFGRGERLEMDARPGEIVLRSARPRYSLAELIEGLSPDEMGAAFDWGDDLGREQLD